MRGASVADIVKLLQPSNIQFIFELAVKSRHPQFTTLYIKDELELFENLIPANLP